MPVVWQEKMSIGNKIIDDEHKYLICLINSVEIALKLEDHSKVMMMLFDQLEEYTSTHFRQEEMLQLKIEYPHYNEHKLEHNKILNKMKSLKERYLESLKAPAGTAEAELAAKAGEDVEHEIVKLLRGWILEHLLKTDMKMKRHLERFPSNYA
jgi:hemerythrin